jgi:hypothetical protein
MTATRSRFKTRFRSGGRRSSLEDAITALFSSGQEGIWDDESDFSTMFQDSAGTVPVTAVGQPVGKILDKSGRGNHATQATAGNRPTLSARVNLLTKTEDFTNAVWAKVRVTASLTGVAAPVGAANATFLQDDTTLNTHLIYTSVAATPPADCTGSIYVKAGTRTKVGFGSQGGLVLNAKFDLSTGVFIYNPSNLVKSEALADGWYRLSLEDPSNSGSIGPYVFLLDAAGNENYTGDGVSGVYIAAAQLEYSATAQRYQRVNTATDYDTVGFSSYSKPDGIDDSLATTAGGGGTAGFMLCAAVKPTGGAGTVRTLFSDTGTNTGYKVQIDAANKLSFSAGNGVAFTTIVTAGTVDVGATNVVTAWDDGVNMNVQIGSGAVASVARIVVTAGTAAITFGKDNGAASSFFTGNIYPQVYRQGSGLTADERTSVKNYIASKSGVTL